MSEVTGLEAKTLHRMLEFDPATMRFKRDKNNPWPYDAVVVDETSMLDLFLAHSLLKAIAPEAQLLLVGDVDSVAQCRTRQSFSRYHRFWDYPCHAS